MPRPDDHLRLEVAAAPHPLRNRVLNPTGANGTYGWLTPATGATLTAHPDAGHGLPGAHLRYGGSPAAPPVVGTEGMIIKAGAWARAKITFGDIAAATTVRLIWRNAAGLGFDYTELGAAAAGQTITLPAAQAPAGTTSVALALVTAGTVAFTDVVVKIAATATDLTAAEMGTDRPPTWHNIIGACYGITVTRRALDLGTITLGIRLPRRRHPIRDIVRENRTVRLRTPAGVIFTGTITHISTSYPRRRHGTPTEIDLTVTIADPASVLAKRTQPRAVATIPGLRAILEAAGVPWIVNGSTAQSYAPTTTGADDATIIDQVVITRDSNLGYAWVTRTGVLTVNDRDHMPTTPAATLTEADYSAIDIGAATDGCINWITVAALTEVTDPETNETTVELVTHGPYTNPQSIEDYGVHQAAFTLNIPPANIPAWADAVLASNAVPIDTVRAVTIPIRHAGDLPKTILDLYDLVTIANRDADITTDVRITGITHTITPKSWLIGLTFDVDEFAAPPQKVPKP